ncbi:MULTISPECIES: type II toxin-antitoxin system RelE/ParE family toxin [unclassified Arthrobacter]|uniref:type II toxin-antitoxin system RelE family toxin n=1 Tax=Pseudarthrobacter sp. S6 TaxID=3418420 RepID=UPI00339AF935
MTGRFGVRYTAVAAKQIRKLDRKAQMRVLKAIEILSDTPRPPKGKQLVGGDGEWRIRTGDYRIIYEIRDQELLILVLRVGHRREVYRSTSGL